MKRLVPYFFLVIAFISFAKTKSSHFFPRLTDDTPSKAGLSSERLNRIENMFAEAIKQKEIPGTCSIDH